MKKRRHTPTLDVEEAVLDKVEMEQEHPPLPRTEEEEAQGESS
jgi:hypothetical protein